MGGFQNNFYDQMYTSPYSAVIIAFIAKMMSSLYCNYGVLLDWRAINKPEPMTFRGKYVLPSQVWADKFAVCTILTDCHSTLAGSNELQKVKDCICILYVTVLNKSFSVFN